MLQERTLRRGKSARRTAVRLAQVGRSLLSPPGDSRNRLVQGGLLRDLWARGALWERLTVPPCVVFPQAAVWKISARLCLRNANVPTLLRCPARFRRHLLLPPEHPGAPCQGARRGMSPACPGPQLTRSQLCARAWCSPCALCPRPSIKMQSSCMRSRGPGHSPRISCTHCRSCANL